MDKKIKRLLDRFITDWPNKAFIEDIPFPKVYNKCQKV